MFSLKKTVSLIHKEGWKFATIFFLTSSLLLMVWLPFAIIGFLLTFFVVWFFRDPDRKTPNIKNKIISPADGKICLIDKAKPPKELLMDSKEMFRICVFMNVFNVHVNRSPVKGTIREIVYKKGQFLNASLDKASEKNERNSLIIETDDNKEIIVTQIAGLIARRILSFVNNKDKIDAGERFGLIRFGSRVDIYLPEGSKAAVKIGDTVKAGETIIGSL
ncbi:MAG: phosphatidylserine decarboxylase [Alphaproteobacteria bacterium]|nr:phosphatidylserine decarboxylase [Alphaproteobacteria bacterium]